MRIRRPRGLLAQQLTAHLLTVAVVGVAWTAIGARFLGQIHEAHDARLAANRVRQRILEARLSAENFLARDVRDPRFFLGVGLPAMEDFSRAMSDADDRITAFERLLPEGHDAAEKLRRLVQRYQSTFLKVTELHRQQGLADWGLEGDRNKALREVEPLVSGHPDLVTELLQVRRSEKDYLLPAISCIR